jgi:hypothetical protein
MVEIAGGLEYHFVSRPAEDHDGKPECLAGSDGEADLPRVDAGAIEAFIAAADRLPHLGQPFVGRIPGYLRLVQSPLEVVDQLRGRRVVGNGLTEVNEGERRGRGSQPPLYLGDGGEMDLEDMLVHGKFHQQFLHGVSKVFLKIVQVFVKGFLQAPQR